MKASFRSAAAPFNVMEEMKAAAEWHAAARDVLAGGRWATGR